MLTKAQESAFAAQRRRPKASPDFLRKGKWMAPKTRATSSWETAEMLAVQALAFIAEEPERLSAFISLTGIASDAMRTAATEPNFLAGVLEHMLGDESLLTAFADSAAIDPAEIGRAHISLVGRKGRDLP
jgi:Protein of unknown function (DUF3572)